MRKLLSFIVASAVTLSSVAAFAAPNRFGVEPLSNVDVNLVTKITGSSSDGTSESNPAIIEVSSSTALGTLDAEATISMENVKNKWNEYLDKAVSKTPFTREQLIAGVDLQSSYFDLTIVADPHITNSAGENATLTWNTAVNNMFEKDGAATYLSDSTETRYTVRMKPKADINQKLESYFANDPLETLSLKIMGSSVSGTNVVYKITSTFSGEIIINVPGHSDEQMIIEFSESNDNYVKQIVSSQGGNGGGGGATPTEKPTPTPEESPTPTPEIPEDLATTVEPQLQGTSSGAKLNYVDHYAYIIGYDNEDGTEVVRPENPITRAEVATIFYRLLTEESRQQFRTQENEFTDVNEGDWFNNNVSTVAAAGIVNGYDDGSFAPNNKITRAEFAAIASRFTSLIHEGENLFNDTEGHWAEDAINNAAITGWINGYDDGSFDPEAEITRAEAITLINRMLYRYIREENMHDDMIDWADNTADKWYYEAVQEATNSHDYDRKDIGYYETHTAIEAPYDWESHEK